MREREIFTGALERTDQVERLAFLEHACGGDAVLRHHIETLLRAHERAQELLQSTPTGLDATTDTVEIREDAGSIIGPYRLLEELGEGGMGVVYLAEQQEPIRRRVAIKIIKPGMDSQHVVTRFEAERQALALMDHEHIARVLDAGTTRTNRPYFVMELARGLPITDYCDKNRLALAERLELFLPVCHAVQHAHQKGIIHRDLKPSNIIITMHDGEPIAKVIDFGIAKSAGQRLTERTLFTQHGQIVGTVQYMSPEQAESGGLDVDTRSDIYSLGVVLYELLTGSTPLTRDRLKDVHLTELLRAVRDEDPPKPSTRVRSATGTQVEIATQRKTEPERLGKSLQGELDWIVMKCLEKDRTRRYATANGLASDIQRFLSDEPVVAGPPSATYRLRKFVKRHRLQVFAAAAVAASLTVGMVGTTVGWIHTKAAESLALQRLDEVTAQKGRAEEAEIKASAAETLALSRLADVSQQKQRAEEAEKKASAEASKAKAVSRFLTNDLLAQANPDANERASQVTVEQLLDRSSDRITGNELFADQPEVEADIRGTLAEAYRALGQHTKAEEHWRRALELSRALYGEEDEVHTLAAMNELARALMGQDRLRDAEELLQKLLPLRRRISGSDSSETLFVINNLAVALGKQGRLEQAEPLFRENWETRRRVSGLNNPDTLQALSNYAALLKHQGHYKDAEPLFRQAIQGYESIGHQDKESGLAAANGLGMVLIYLNEYDEAAELLRKTADSQVRVQGPNHPATLGTLTNLGYVLSKLGRIEESLGCLRRAYEGHREWSGPEHEQTFAAMNSLALALREAKRWDEAQALMRELLEICSTKQGTDHSATLIYRNNLGWILEGQGEFDAAEAMYRDAATLAPTTFGPEHPKTLIFRHCLARILLRLNRFAESEKVGREVWASRKTALGPQNRDTLGTANNLAAAIQEQGRLDEAEVLFREVLAGRREIQGGAEDVATTLLALASNLMRQQRLAEAEPVLLECLAIRERQFAGGWQVFEARSLLGELLTGARRFDAAESALLESHRGLEQHQDELPPESKSLVAKSRQRLVRLYETWDKPDEAARWQIAPTVSRP